MTAKEMFEALGYVQKKPSYDRAIYYEFESRNGFDSGKGFLFDLDRHTCYPHGHWGQAAHLNLEEYEAITQQMKELGWIE